MQGNIRTGGGNGQGAYIYSDGSKYVGEYKNQIPWNGTGYNKDGEIVVRFVNGKEIKP